MKLLKRLVMLCLCLALVAASACAENVTELDSGEGDTYLYYDRTLPDGRLLLCGIREGSDFLTGSYRKAWLKCLNTDRTVSWEWLDGDGGEDWIVHAAVTKDKNIAVVFRRFGEDDNDRIIVKFLNMDGEPTGNELSIPMGSGSLWPDDATASYFRLENQIEMLKQFCFSNGYIISGIYADVASGINFEKRKEFFAMLDDILAGKVERVVITYKDRLSRVGYELFLHLFLKFHCEIVVMSEIGSTKLDSQEIFEEIISLLHCYSMKLYSKRKEKRIREVLMEDAEEETGSGKG